MYTSLQGGATVSQKVTTTPLSVTWNKKNAVTGFRNSFPRDSTANLYNEFITKNPIPHLKSVATLPCVIFGMLLTTVTNDSLLSVPF